MDGFHRGWLGGHEILSQVHIKDGLSLSRIAKLDFNIPFQGLTLQRQTSQSPCQKLKSVYQGLTLQSQTWTLQTPAWKSAGQTLKMACQGLTLQSRTMTLQSQSWKSPCPAPTLQSRTSTSAY
jgi:hypothetical protein